MTFLLSIVRRTPLAVTLLATFAYSGKAASERSNVAVLNGQVGVTKSSGEVVAPESATVYVFFARAMAGNSFSHALDVDTAGGQFSYHLNNLLAKNKELKSLMKSVRHNPRPEDASQIAAYYLQSIDEALASVGTWLTKHPDRTWQMETILPDEKGLWSAEGLHPGGYEIVVRGEFSGYDADWEATLDLAPGSTISVPLTRPRFFRHK